MGRKPARSRLGKRYARPGTAPGTLVAREEGPGAPARLTRFSYSPEQYEEVAFATFDDTAAAFPPWATVNWINIDGLSDVPLLEAIGSRFGLHPLTLEDILNCGQRPKFEDYEDNDFLVIKSLALAADQLEIEQISLFIGPHYVLTFQEIPGDTFAPVRERIRRGHGRIRSAGCDYLAYALIDALVDEFFPVLEGYGERLEQLEEELIAAPHRQTLQTIYRMKRDLLNLRRVAWPERELISRLLREDADTISAETKVYLRDCYDHLAQVIDIIETFRELAAGMIDIYLSSLSNRMNEVMKVLTVISTIFIPLTFIAGVYGMNFDYMPELKWRYGYPFSLALMAAVAFGLILYFRRKKWF